MVAPRAAPGTDHLGFGSRRWGGAGMLIISAICVEFSHALGLEDLRSDLLDSEILKTAVGEETFDKMRVGFG